MLESDADRLLGIVPGAAVAWAIALLLIATLLVALAHGWSRASSGSPLRRGLWLLVAAGLLQLLLLPFAGLVIATGLLRVVVAACVVLAVLRAAPRRGGAVLREQGFEAVLAGAVAAFLVWSLSTGTGVALALDLLAFAGQVGALWLVCLGPRTVRPQSVGLRWLLGLSLLLLAGLSVGSLAAGPLLMQGPLAGLLVALPVLLWAGALVHPASLRPTPHLARGEQVLSAAQVGLVVAGVAVGPVTVVVRDAAETTVSLPAVALGAVAVALLAVLHLILLASERGRQVWRAQHDALTGLPTEPLYEDRLRQAIAAARRSGREVGVAFVDLDGFKEVNDTQGHEAGDEVLRQVARRLGASLRAQDTVARRSGDEFLVLLPHVAGPDAVELVVARLLEAVAEPLVVDGEEHRVGASVGVALWPRDGQDAAEVVANADAAMYEAKDAGRGQMRWYRATTAARTRLRLTVGEQLRSALDDDELDVDYELLVDLRDGSVEGLTTHARWNHPHLGRLRPAAFLPAAAASGLSVAVDLHLLGLVCRRAARWERAGWLRVPTVVALSDAAAVRDDLAPRVLDIVAASGLSPDLLTLSVSEDGLRRGDAVLARSVSALAERGIGVRVRDFGSSDVGIARLSHVRVAGIELSAHLVERVRGVELPVVEAAVLLAEGLGLAVSAAGVEQEEQAEVLRSRGCAVARGPALAAVLESRHLDLRLHQLATRADHDPGAILALELGPPTGELPRAPTGVVGVLEAALAEQEELTEAILVDALRRLTVPAEP